MQDELLLTDASAPAHTAHSGPSEDPTAISLAPTSTYLSLAAHLHELSIHVSARTADSYWPPEDVSPTPPDLETYVSSAAAHGGSVMIGGERPIISIIAQGGLLKYNMALGYMEVAMRLRRFVIEDCLLGAVNPGMRYLARSFEEHDSSPGEAVAGAEGAGTPPCVFLLTRYVL